MVSRSRRMRGEVHVALIGDIKIIYEISGG
jgi:hypothetical protein